MNELVYTRDEMRRLDDQMPDRGPVCPRCRQHIPQFADFAEVDRQRVAQLIQTDRRIQAMQELRAFTGCPLTWAKLWVLHSGRPDASGTTAPCPYCGNPLVTALAKQCRYCFMDWHDPDHAKSLV